MGLPHYNSHKIQSIEPIYINNYEAQFITKSGDVKIAHIERYDIVDDTLTCKFQDMPDVGYDDIKNTDILLISHINKPGNIIRIDILQVKNTSFKTETFSWSDMGLSSINCSFSIQNINTLSENDVNARSLDSVVNSYKRDIKLNSVLD